MSDLKKLADDIAASGVKDVFGIPGSGPSLTLLDYLEQRGVAFHLTHIEATAALMAGAVGRLSGKAGVAVGIKGPGLCNMVPGLAACQFDGFPIVSISEAYLPNIPLTKAHKRIDHIGLVSAVTKGRRFLSQHGPDFLELARWAESEVPAPVHLDISANGVEKEAEIPSAVGQGSENNGLSTAVRQRLQAAKCPVIIAGSLALRQRWHERLNTLNIPVFSVASAKGVVDETRPHAAGVFTGVGAEYAPERTILPQADLVISLGLRHHEILGVKPFLCPSMTVDCVDSSYFFGFEFNEMIENSPNAIDELFHELADKQWGTDLIQECHQKLREKMLSGQFLAPHAYRCIEQHFQHNARLILDTGNFCTIGEHAWRVKDPDLYLASAQGRYMGVGLPLAIGASLYDSSVPTVAFLGDGGIGMFIAEMKLAVQKKLPLLVVLMTDSYFGCIRTRALKDQLTQHPVTIHQPSWQQVMEGLGVSSVRIENESQLESALKHWNPSDGPSYIEIEFDPDLYQAMVTGIR